jgi:hypothetical protein
VARLLGLLTLCLCGAAVTAGAQADDAGVLKIEHTQIAALGGEHIAHAIYRQTPTGGSIVGWGERVVEWPLESPQLREVVAREGSLRYYNGGCAIDVDGDGRDEIVVARGKTRAVRDPDLVWLEETTPGGKWAVHKIETIGPGAIAPHDIVPFSASLPGGKSVRGVVAVLDRQRLVWYEMPDDPRQPWPRRAIADLPRRGQSGIAVGDLAGHGRADVACGMFWAECPADPTTEPWKIRRFGRFDDGGWGGMAKLAIADMDRDGQLDILASEAEIPDARLGIFTRDRANPDGLWKLHEVDSGLYCPHSLIVADLDADGRRDVIAGEMTAGGWSFPLHPRPRVLAYLAHSDGSYHRIQISAGRGVHEMSQAPPERKGELTIFAADEIQPQKFPDMQTHVNLWTIRGRAPLEQAR